MIIFISFCYSCFFKSLLFLLCGLISHSFKDQQDLRQIHLYYTSNPLFYVLLFLGICFLIGIPSFISNYSKELILLINLNIFNATTYFFLIFSISLTVLYVIKLITLFSINKFNRVKKFYQQKGILLFILNIPIFLLLISSYIKYDYLLELITITNYYKIINFEVFIFNKHFFINF